MADTLHAQGKVAAMTGLISDFEVIQLRTSTALITQGSVLNTDYTVNATTGELTNDNALVFTLAAGDIGKTATQVRLLDSVGNDLITVDLDTSLTINYAGEATIAAGDLKVTL